MEYVERASLEKSSEKLTDRGERSGVRPPILGRVRPGANGATRRVSNRDRILRISVDLFNQSGVVAITTNHIAESLKISPGNLYFHFRSKEVIVRELFEEMREVTYALFREAKKSEPVMTPLALVERSFEIFWAYRFFHREMYHLRRKDPQLAREWKRHMRKVITLLRAVYFRWVEEGIMREIRDEHEMEMVAEVILVTSSAFLQFFETRESPPSRKSLRHGIRHVMRIILPYHTEAGQREIREFLKD